MMGRQVFGVARSLVCYKEVHLKKNTCRYRVSWWSLAGPTCHEVRSSRHTHPQSLCQEVGHIQPCIGADGILCEIQERQQVIAKDLNVWEIRSGHKIGSKAIPFCPRRGHATKYLTWKFSISSQDTLDDPLLESSYNTPFKKSGGCETIISNNMRWFCCTWRPWGTAARPLWRRMATSMGPNLGKTAHDS